MRFMHIADVHLGAIPDGRTAWGENRKKEIWDTFRRCIADAVEKQVDLLLIAGDLFHRQPTVEELREVNYLFSTLPSTRVVLIAGNHDYLQPISPYLNFPWSRNVVCLFSGECECIRFPEIKTEVYGFSYHRQEITEPLYDGLHPIVDGVRMRHDDTCRILLAHGGDALHIPINRKALAGSGFDYIALGHIHKPQILLENKAAYSGALEPIDCNDTGVHGYIMGTFEKGRVRTEFVPKARREYRELVVPVQTEDTTFSLQDRLEQLIEQNGWEHIYRIVLRGSRNPGTCFDAEKLTEYGMVLEVRDETTVYLQTDELRHRYAGSVIARYIDSFSGQDRSTVEEKALQYGLEALLDSEKR